MGNSFTGKVRKQKTYSDYFDRFDENLLEILDCRQR